MSPGVVPFTVNLHPHGAGHVQRFGRNAVFGSQQQIATALFVSQPPDIRRREELSHGCPPVCNLGVFANQLRNRHECKT